MEDDAVSTSPSFTRHTCLKLDLPTEDPKANSVVFVKGTWFPSRFGLAISDGLNAWPATRQSSGTCQCPRTYRIPSGSSRSMYGFEEAGNGQWRDEVVRKTQSFEKMKSEAEKCLLQSEKFSKEKPEFRSAVYSKFIAILNSKKAKRRQWLGDRISKLESAGKAPKDEDASTDQTESFNGASDDEI